MATSQLHGIVGHLRTTALLAGGDGVTDGRLLECFLSQHDEAAFAALVRRHGPMVLAVCRRVLGNWHDAEDAFQATFLVLVRKAAGIGRRELLGHWLYGVAYRTAKKAHTARARRRTLESQVPVKTRPQAAEDSTREFLPLLDQEVHALPEKYRVPVVLCDLEAKTRKEAARLVGCPEGTLSTRLMRGRTLLARRLTRRGVVLSAASLATLVPPTAAAAVAPLLITATTRAAAMMATGAVGTGVSTTVSALTEGVLKAMWLTKLKVLAAVLLVGGCVGGGLVLLGPSTRAGEQAEAGPEALPQAAPPKADRPQADPEKLQETLLTLEKQTFESLKKQDADALKATTAADFVAVLSNGDRLDRNGLLSLRELMHFRLKDYSLEDVQLVPITPEAALLMYRVKSNYTILGVSMTEDLRVSSTWVRRHGKWWNVFYQETEISP
jgi:RNA polymerase sigma factor (sigma-70 family)